MFRPRVTLIGRITSSYWVIPAAFVLLAVGAALGLPELDAAVDGTLTVSYTTSAATELLSAISAGMIAFTGFVFAIIILLVQFGSSQYSPRLLRRFMQDPVPKFAIGIFSATFVYSLFVLSGIGKPDDPNFVPDLSVTTAVAMVVFSVFAFLWLLHHSYQSVRLGNVVRMVAEQSRRAIEITYPDPAEPIDHDDRQEWLNPEEEGRVLRHLGGSGIVQNVDSRRLLRLAEETDSMLLVRVSLGDFVPAGGRLLVAHGPGAETLKPERVGRAFSFDVERGIEVDPAQGIRWLVDIAIKALSPAVNDPTTAVQAIDHIDDLLRRLGTRSLLLPGLHDREGALRVAFLMQTWRDYLELAFTEIRRYGSGSMQIERRLLALLLDLQAVVPDYRRPAIDEQLALLAEGIADTYPERERAVASVADRQGIGWARRRAA